MLSSFGVAKAQMFMSARPLPQLGEFSDQELKELVLISTYCTFKSADETIAKVEQASCLYPVIDSEVGARADPFEFIQLEAGECVGEVGTLTGKPRTATVVALDRCGFLSITTSLLHNSPISCPLHLKNVLLRTLASQFVETQELLC